MTNTKDKLTLTFAQILTVIPGLQELASIKMDLKQSYDVARVLRKIGEEHDAYHKQRDAKVKEIGTPNDQGGYNIPTAERTVLDEQIVELDKVEVTVDTAGLKYSLLEAIESSWKKANPDKECTLFTPRILASLHEILDMDD